jgi:oligopeptide transport system ATP-binding protein
VTTPLIGVDNLHTSFFIKAGVVKAVTGVSFEVSAGETVGVVGESGCGKTVTGLSLMRLVPSPGRIVQGQIFLDGTDLMRQTEDEMRRIRGATMAMIFQDPMTSLNPVLTISRQITESITAHTGCTLRKAKQKAVELLDLVGISSAKKRIDEYPHQFSGGMRQRVMIAIAISCDPRILIADEPTTSLDVTIQAQIIALMKGISAKRGTSIILITHDLGIVASMCRRVAVMYAGRIVETAAVTEIFTGPRHPYTYGVLNSTPRMDVVQKKLKPIGGLPPSLLNPPPQCAFAPRCTFVQDRCWKSDPQQQEIKAGHYAACFRSGEQLW